MRGLLNLRDIISVTWCGLCVRLAYQYAWGNTWQVSVAAAVVVMLAYTFVLIALNEYGRQVRRRRRRMRRDRRFLNAAPRQQLYWAHMERKERAYGKNE